MTLKWVRFDTLAGLQRWQLDTGPDNNLILSVQKPSPNYWFAEVHIEDVVITSQRYSGSTRLEAQRAAVALMYGWMTAVQELVGRVEESTTFYPMIPANCWNCGEPEPEVQDCTVLCHKCGWQKTLSEEASE